MGPTECRPGAKAGELTRSVDGIIWSSVPGPGTTVSWLDAASTDTAVATVFDAACAASVVTTADGGATWETLDASGALSRVSLGRPGGRWALSAGQVVREVDGRFVAPAAKPCVGTQVAAASAVAAVSASDAFVLCQAGDGSGRLLVRTRDGGRRWTRLAGKLSASGLDGTGRIAAMHVASPTRAVVLLQGAGCPAGEVRVTSNGGVRWSALPCVTLNGQPVRAVLDVVVRADGSYLLAARTNSVQMLTSAAGSTWTVVA